MKPFRSSRNQLMCNGDHLSRKIGFLRKPYFYFLESVCVCVCVCAFVWAEWGWSIRKCSYRRDSLHGVLRISYTFYASSKICFQIALYITKALDRNKSNAYVHSFIVWSDIEWGVFLIYVVKYLRLKIKYESSSMMVYSAAKNRHAF